MWSTIQRVVTGPSGTDENHSVEISMQMKAEGAWGLPEYQVGAVWGLSRKSHTRKRTFKGETAQMDAQRLYDDIYTAVKYG